MIGLNKVNFAIAAIAGTEDDRCPAVLTGLLVTPSETLASDGYCAIRVTGIEMLETLFEPQGIDVAQAWTPFILRRDAALKIAKAFPKRKKKGPEPIAAIDCRTESSHAAVIQVGDESLDEILRSSKIPGNYPDVVRHFDLSESKVTLLFRPHLLLSALKQIVAMGALEVTLSVGSADKPIILEASNRTQRMTAAIAPMKV